MQVHRYQRSSDMNARNPSLFTMDIDGSHLVQCINHEQWGDRKGKTTNAGNHPNWHPDGEHIVMNFVC